jgi:trans-aconitate methyltransferase
MYSATARYYDLIYTRFKNYTDESRNIAALIKTVHPQAKTILDVACGTGEHARILSEMFGYEVDGLDLEADFVSMAAAKNPRGNFYHADMQDFELTKKYEVVMCLFSSIGYAKTLDKVVKSLTRPAFGWSPTRLKKSSSLDFIHGRGARRSLTPDYS